MPNPQKNLYKKLLGSIGEDRAESFLRKKGYKIIEKNYKNRFGEIDLIGLYADFLVFFEVKTRTGFTYGVPSEAVNYAKQQHIKKCAEYYLLCHRNLKLQPRFDVIEVFEQEINHIEDAFQ